MGIQGRMHAAALRRWLGVLLAGSVALAACSAGPSASGSPMTDGAGSSAGASAGATGVPTPTPTPEPTPADATSAAGLALIRPVDGVGQVFVIEADGSARQVTGFGEHAALHAVRPFWSPDRTLIAFRPRPIGAGVDPQLWLVNADGSNQRPIADVGESIGWSPDSTRLLFEDSVYTTDTTGEPARMWLVDVASGGATVLGRGHLPQFLPDGVRFSFVPIQSGPQESTFPIVVMPLAGGDPVQVAVAQGAWWSADGTALLLQQDDGLHLADADGSNSRHLVDGGTPVWSPDGSRVAYAYDVTADALPIIGVVDREGEVIWSGAVGSEPSWSPDGTKLAVEVGYPETSIAILDAQSGEVIWQLNGEDPSW